MDWPAADPGLFITLDEDGDLQYWDVESASETDSIVEEHILSVQSHPARSLVATGHESGKVKIQDFETGEIAYTGSPPGAER